MRYSDTQKTQKILSMANTFSGGMGELTGGRCLLGGSLARAMKIDQWDTFNDVDLFVTNIPDMQKAIWILTKEGWVPMVADLTYCTDFVVLEKIRLGVRYQVILSTDSLNEIVERVYTSLSWFFYRLERVLQDGVIMTIGEEQAHCRTELANELIQKKMVMVDYSLAQRPAELQRKHSRSPDLLGYKTFEYRRHGVE